MLHFNTINLQEKMENTTQAEPSAWSLAEEVPEGTDLGSLHAPVTKKVPSWCDGKSSSGSRIVSAAKSNGGVNWRTCVVSTQ